MAPNDPNKTDIDDNEPNSLPNQSNENVITPGAPELPPTPSDTDAPTNIQAAPVNSVNETPSYESNIATEVPDTSPTPEVINSPEMNTLQSPVLEQPVAVMTPQDEKKGKKKFGLLAIVVAILLLAGGGAGAYFGVYLPSKPENIWKSAMSNSGKVYDEAVTFASKDREKTAMKIEGTYDIDGAVESDGKVNGEWKGLDGNVNGEISAAGLKIGFDARTIKATDDSADLYFKLTGLQGLGTLIGGGQMGDVVNGINDQWFVVDHTLIEQAVSASGEKYTKEDITALMQKAGGPTKEYLLSSDPQKAVFEVRQQIGSEKKDGRNTYHYKVGYNNVNFGKYIEALCDAIKDDKIGKLALQNESKSCADLGKEAAEEKTEETADVWVDKRTKLPHVVRVTDSENAENWLELGQDFQGGDEFPMSFKLHTKQDKQDLEVDFKAVVNTKTDASTLDGTFSSKGGADQNISGKVSLKLTPTNNDSVKVDKPENAKSIIELLNSLGLGDLIGGLRGGSGNSTPSTLGIQDFRQSVQ